MILDIILKVWKHQNSLHAGDNTNNELFHHSLKGKCHLEVTEPHMPPLLCKEERKEV